MTPRPDGTRVHGPRSGPGHRRTRRAGATRPTSVLATLAVVVLLTACATPDTATSGVATPDDARTDAAPRSDSATNPSGAATASSVAPGASEVDAGIPRGWVGVDGGRVPLVGGSSCWTTESADGTSVGQCADGPPPGPGEAVVSGLGSGDAVTLEVSVAASDASIGLVGSDDATSLGAPELTDGHASWRWEVPAPGTWELTVVGEPGTGNDATFFLEVSGTGGASPTTPAPAPTATRTAPRSAAEEYAQPFPGPAWTTAAGEPAVGVDISLAAGAARCDWQSATFLVVPWPVSAGVAPDGESSQYVWDPDQALAEFGITRDQVVPVVPDDALATGWHTAHQELWLGDDAVEAAYLVAEDGTVRRLQRPVVEPGGTLACG